MMAAEASDDLYSLLAPLAGGRLIVPRTCITEIIGSSGIQPVPDAPAWLLGTVSWNGRKLPVVSFEGACRRDVPEIGRRARIAVFVALTEHLPAGHLGVLTQGFPQLVRVNPGVLELDPDPQYASDVPVLCQLRMLNERPLVPDLERLEEMTAEYLTGI